MLNNPIQILQLIGQLKNNPNPIAAMQTIFGNNPRFAQVMDMARGKSPEELKQTAMNLCKTRGINWEQVQYAAKGMGINL